MVPDSLRWPPVFDPSRTAYKDWLHLNVFDHATGSVGVINASLHGAPDDRRARAIGTGVFHVPGVGWVGNVEVRGIDEAGISLAAIGLEQVALAVDHATDRVMASVRFPDDGLMVELEATASTSALVVEEPLPLGPGWISWYAVPRLSVSGEATILGRRHDLSGASAYHDHNWGRWHWGEDLGWQWGCFLAPAPGPALVFTRTTDRTHHGLGRPMLVVRTPGARRTFVGPMVEAIRSGRSEGRLRRLPGALAALHQDRAAPALPASLRITAADGIDDVEIEFVADGATQLVAADPSIPGYGFIHEIAGRFTCRGRVGGFDVAAEGLGVIEHVD